MVDERLGRAETLHRRREGGSGISKRNANWGMGARAGKGLAFDDHLFAFR